MSFLLKKRCPLSFNLAAIFKIMVLYLYFCSFFNFKDKKNNSVNYKS